MPHPTLVYADKKLASYHFGKHHPFGPKRFDAFLQGFKELKLDNATDIGSAVPATREMLEWFHTSAYVEKVIKASKTGDGYLDRGDTPAIKGIYDACRLCVGSVLDAVDRIIDGEYKRAFIPIAGLHHAQRNSAAGFCVFNDCGVAIEALRKKHGIKKVAYIDIDAHHGDGVFYAFEEDPDLIFADIHEDGRFLYPGTGDFAETGKGKAKGTKLNIPMKPESKDKDFMAAWKTVDRFLMRFKPEFILLQCGADSMANDPITHMMYSEKAHAHAAECLCDIAEKYAKGRIVAMGGGGYNLNNIKRGWNAVVKTFAEFS
jgi:acetoin utilization protein AcuC